MQRHKPSVTIYTPEPLLRHPWRLLGDMSRDLLSSHELAWQLASRDVRAQYRQTALGLLWAFLIPVASTVTWIFMQRTGVIRIGDTGMPYAAFVLTGTMLWWVFMDAVNAPLRQATSALQMLSKINFPREALVLSGIYQTLFHGAVRMLVVLGALLLLGISPGWSVVLVPVVVASLTLVGTTLGVLITPLGLLYGDVARVLPLSTQFLMFLAPVVYPVPRSGIAASVLEWNPLTPLIIAGRSFLVGGGAVPITSFALVTVASALFLVFTLVAYRASMPILIERMSA